MYERKEENKATKKLEEEKFKRNFIVIQIIK